MRLRIERQRHALCCVFGLLVCSGWPDQAQIGRIQPRQILCSIVEANLDWRAQMDIAQFALAAIEHMQLIRAQLQAIAAIGPLNLLEFQGEGASGHVAPRCRQRILRSRVQR